MNETQLSQVQELAALYAEPLNEHRNEVSDEVKGDLRKAWLAFRDSAAFTEASEADLAALGAMLPILMAMESQSPEQAKMLAYYMMFSLLDENL